jgi:hypothetical protein
MLGELRRVSFGQKGELSLTNETWTCCMAKHAGAQGKIAENLQGSYPQPPNPR